MDERDYHISKYEYLELKYFCLQCGEKKKYINSCRTNGYSVMNSVERAINDFKQIETALELATDNEIIREYLRLSVTTDTKFDLLDVPMGRRQFYALRRKFFYILRDLRHTEIFSERR